MPIRKHVCSDDIDSQLLCIQLLAGIIVDLFAEGKVLPQLEQVLFLATGLNSCIFSWSTKTIII